MAYKNMQEVIDVLSKKYHIDEEDKKIWLTDCNKVYAGHFIVIPDRARPGEGGGKWHLICIPDKPKWVHVYTGYRREEVEEVASWCVVTGPFTSISQVTDNSNFGKGRRTGFKSYFPNEIIYGGRFFIERVPQVAILYQGPTIQHYNVYGCTDDGRDVVKIYDFENNLPGAKRFCKLITQWSKPEGEINAIELARKLTGGAN